MIHAVLICWSSLITLSYAKLILLYFLVNTSGVPRLTKFYTPLQQSSTQTLVQKIYALVSSRPATLCNFLDAPELESFLKPGGDDEEKLRVVYRNYATLYFVFLVDGAESELGVLDLIQVRFREPVISVVPHVTRARHRYLLNRSIVRSRTCAN